MYISVNFLAVIAATIISMTLGFLWYSPVLFAKPWMKLMGLSSAKLKKGQKSMNSVYAISTVAAFVTAWVLAKLMTVTAFWSPSQATWLAFELWLGFIAPIQLTEVLFGGKKWGLYLINTGYQLVSVILMAWVISFWR